MIFECFYYPKLNNNNKVIKCIDNLKEFNTGDLVPSKTLYYNYGENFIIYQGDEFFKVEKNKLLGSINISDISFPCTIVFNKGTQLKISNPKQFNSIRLVLKGEFELEKELGNLFFLYNSIMIKIKYIQYDILSTLTNSCRDLPFLNDEIDISTKKLIDDLNIVKSKVSKLLINNMDLKKSYLEYMNFKDSENSFNLSIYKYFNSNSDEYENMLNYIINSKSQKICPKTKLENMINSCDIS